MNVKVLNILRSLFFNVRKKRGLAIFEFLGGEGGGGEWIFSGGPEDFLQVVSNC